MGTTNESGDEFSLEKSRKEGAVPEREPWSQQWGMKEARWPSPPGQPVAPPSPTHCLPANCMRAAIRSCQIYTLPFVATQKGAPGLNSFEIPLGLQMKKCSAFKVKWKFGRSIYFPLEFKRERNIPTVSLCICIFLSQVERRIVIGGILYKQKVL